MQAVEDLWGVHQAEISVWKSRLRTERKIYHDKVKRLRSRYKKKAKVVKRAHQVEMDNMRSDVRQRLRKLEKAAKVSRAREYAFSLELERHRYGYIQAENRIERMHQKAQDACQDGSGTIMEIDEIPHSQLPYNHPAPSHPVVSIPSGSLIPDQDIVMSESDESDR